MLKLASIYKAPEIQTMYSLNVAVSEIRTKIRQEYERHRFVNKLPVVDMLIFQSDAEYQVCCQLSSFNGSQRRISGWIQEILSY